jgi:ribosomal protein L21E
MMRVLKAKKGIDLLSKVSFKGKIGRVVGISPALVTVAFRDGEVKTLSREDILPGEEEFEIKEPVKILVDGDFYDGMIIKRLKDNLYLVIMEGNQFVSDGEFLDKLRKYTGPFDGWNDTNLGKDEYKDYWKEPH